MKFMKKTFLAGVIVIALGIVFAIIGWIFNGGQSIKSVAQSDYNKGSHVEKYSKDINNDQIRNIKLDSALPVYLYSGDKFQVKVNADKRNDVQTEMKDKQLLVKSKRISPSEQKGILRLTHFKIGNGYADGSYINISVPKNIHLDSIQQDDSSGGTQLSNLNVGKINLGASFGNVDLDNVKSDHQIQLDGSVGDISVNASKAPSLNLSNDSGDTNVSNSNFDEARSKITSQTGDVNLKSNSWYDLSGYNDTGDVNFDYQKLKHNFRFDNDTGDIDGKIKPEKDILISTDNDSGDTDVYRHHPTTKQIRNYVFTNSTGDIEIEK